MAQKKDEIVNKEKEEKERKQKEALLLEKQKKEKASQIRQQRIRVNITDKIIFEVVLILIISRSLVRKEKRRKMIMKTQLVHQHL